MSLIKYVSTQKKVILVYYSIIPRVPRLKGIKLGTEHSTEGSVSEKRTGNTLIILSHNCPASQEKKKAVMDYDT